jgi:purine-binding chemotaxis protein CheW
VNAATVELSQRLVTLRHDFDQTFAEPAQQPGAPHLDLLAIVVAHQCYALPLAMLSGLFAGQEITPLPSARLELLGVAGFRGAVVAVYDLRVLLGHPVTGAPRWLVTLCGTPRIAVAFDHLEGHLRVPGDAVALWQADAVGPAYTAAVASTPDGVWPVLDVDAVRAACVARDPTGSSNQEAVPDDTS